MSYMDLPTRVFTAGEALAAYRLVTIGDNDVVLADAGDPVVIGSTGIDGAVADGADVNVRLWNAPGTRRLTAGGAIIACGPVAVAADGKVVARTDETTIFGIALEAAAADGDVIEVLPFAALFVIPTGS